MGRKTVTTTDIAAVLGLQVVRVKQCPHCAFAWITTVNSCGEHDTVRMSAYNCLIPDRAFAVLGMMGNCTEKR